MLSEVRAPRITRRLCTCGHDLIDDHTTEAPWRVGPCAREDCECVRFEVDTWVPIMQLCCWICDVVRDVRALQSRINTQSRELGRVQLEQYRSAERVNELERKVRNLSDDILALRAERQPKELFPAGSAP